MPFWRHKTPEEEAAAAERKQQDAALAELTQRTRDQAARRSAQDLDLLSRGGLPSMATQRLTELRQGAEGGTFTSDLSPDEAALLRRNGYKVLGLVSGSAVYHVGIAYVSGTGDCEV